MNNYTQLLIIHAENKKISDVIVKSLCQGQTDINLPTSTNSRVMQVSITFFIDPYRFFARNLQLI